MTIRHVGRMFFQRQDSLLHAHNKLDLHHLIVEALLHTVYLHVDQALAILLNVGASMCAFMQDCTDRSGLTRRQ
jgi:hypothetical protein